MSFGGKLAAFVALAGIGVAWGQGVITTVAGTDFVYPNSPQPGPKAPLVSPAGLAFDNAGNLYIAAFGNRLILKLDSKGMVTVAAGNGVLGGSGEGGPAASASVMLTNVGDLKVDRNGNLVFVDGLRIRKITPDGTISTIAGNGTFGLSGDGGPAIKATLSFMRGIAMDAAGNIFFTQFNSSPSTSSIRKITPGGIISTIAGGPSGFSGDNGAASTASFSNPSGLAVDSAGNLYVADTQNNRVRKISTNGIVTTVAGNGSILDGPDGARATSVPVFSLFGLTFDSAGNLLISESSIFPVYHRIRKLSPEGILTTVAGGPAAGFSGDGGPASKALLSTPKQIALSSAGDLFISDYGNNRIRRVGADGTITTVVGSGASLFGGDGGPATTALLNSPSGVTGDGAGGLFVADSENNRIRRVSAEGIITTVAGNGTRGFSGDGGPALSASLNAPHAMALDAKGNLFFVDTGNNRVRRVTATGQISTVAGNGVFGALGDGGPATNATLSVLLSALAADSSGNLFIAGASSIRKVNPAGIISTLVTLPTVTGIGGRGLDVDAAGNLYFTSANRVMKMAPSGAMSVIAGKTEAGFAGDGGPAADAVLNQPGVLSINSAGNVYVADSGNNRIRKISANGMISTIAGNGTVPSNAGTNFVDVQAGDGGPATSASPFVSDLYADAADNVFIASFVVNRVREVLAAPPRVVTAPAQLQFSAPADGALPPAQTLLFSGAVPGLTFSAQPSAPWLKVSPTSGAAPRLIEVTADPIGLAPGSYTGTIVITAPFATPSSSSVTVSFTVTAALPPVLSTDKPSFSFPFPRNGTKRSQTVTVSNSGGGRLEFSVAARTVSGGNWLSVSSASGEARPSAAVTLAVTADPTGLSPGTYSGSLIVVAGTDVQTLPVVMTISAINQAILLSQTGMSFLGVSQGGILPPQTFGVINIGTGVVNYTVSKSTLSGGPDWLQIDTTSGSTDAAAATVPTVSISVNASILPAGNYYGLVQVDAPDAANSPQVVTVFVQVLAAGSDPGAAATPSEQLFTTTATAGSPSSQNLLLYNLSAAAKSFRSVAAADAGLAIGTLPTVGTLDPQQATRVVVQPFTDGLAPGVYNGTVTLQFSDGRVRELKLSVVVASDGKSSISGVRGVDAVCKPASLLQALTTLGQSFSVSAGYPVGLGVQVTDDCGTPLDTGSVSVSFSNGDPTVPLQPLKGGRWEGTWNTRDKNAGQVTLTLKSSDPQGLLRGERQIRGVADATANPPVFDKRGVVSAASAQSFVPLAPGSIVSIYGDRLATGTQAYSTAPLPQQMTGTSVFMSGRTLPLYFVSPGQINAQVPFDLNVNTQHQIQVRSGITASQPIYVDVAPAQPAIFAIVPQTPARTGDVLVIYASGMGPVNPQIPTGAAASLTTLSTVTNQVQITIGSQTAPVAFAGLAPGFVGLYQINTNVPEGVPPGNAVPVLISVAGQTGPPATIAVQ